VQLTTSNREHGREGENDPNRETGKYRNGRNGGYEGQTVKRAKRPHWKYRNGHNGDISKCCNGYNGPVSDKGKY